MASKGALMTGAIIMSLIDVLIGVYVLPVVITGWEAVDLNVNISGSLVDLTWLGLIGIILFGIAIAVLPFALLYMSLKAGQ